jgi:hypothetical protein
MSDRMRKKEEAAENLDELDKCFAHPLSIDFRACR